METYALLAAILIAGVVIRGRQQQRRIALLGSYLQPYRIEKLMETLADGYLRALGEQDAERQQQIWALMDTNESALVEQLRRFALDIAEADADSMRVSRLTWALPFVERLLPGASFDLRKLIAIHARGIASVAANEAGRERREKAFMLSAEMFLLQHSCHWYCKSSSVASARLLARHRSSYGQVLGAVSDETRRAYLAITGGVRES